ncbi:MAG: 3-hydroxyacyl-CoA dehydrogenase NAD-binding domain-containing protein [Cyclobacteriaceae bacterium]|nr:3-hydroxyacyl-CoA dehydrogenase NAD-binding domain-containing protein [Cyclobacteriaceae bacterium]MDH4294663.1 3-hydroxyacyl-CoA dehydrogenase NAD-binding domain-containing protein [Cyclobacteriaceae bacterium]MDH5247503.1 3-hydroxyacyl-CoA dehydrogenase NAD-binding domain-containing protein [Cyclobacteriaceae bacterium]
MVKSIRNIAVIGAGTMGQGIAEACAMAGYPVLLYDIQPDLVKKAIGGIRKNLAAGVDRDRITESQKDEALGRIQAAGDFRKLQVDLAIEAVIEKLEVKQKILAELEKINAVDCLLVSNTSSLRITQIGSALKHKERFAGLHFFNPAPVMKLVEIVRGAATSDHTILTLRSFVNSISKSAVIVADSPGFIVNRVARLFYAESLKIVEDGVADFKTIDKLLKCSGFKMGPFQLMDLIGVDTNFAVTTSMYDAFYHDPKFRPSRIQQQMVDARHYGRKSGKGFYEYPQS